MVNQGRKRKGGFPAYSRRVRPRKGVRRRRSKRGYRRSSGISGPNYDMRTVMRVTPRREKIERVKLCTQVCAPYSSPTVSVHGPSYTVAASTFFENCVLDPTGSWSMPTSNGGAGAALPAQQWSSYSALYTHFRITKVTIKFNAVDPGQLDQASPVLYVRYNNQNNTIAPVFADVTREAGWVKKTFNDANPYFQYSVYPKCFLYGDNRGTLSTSDYIVPKKMPWCQTSTTPPELFGLKYIIVKPTGDASAIYLDFVYTVEFKGRK